MMAWLSPDFLFRNALLGGLGVALLCSALGVYLVLRRLVLIGVALPQASAAGIALVFWLSGHVHTGGASQHGLALLGSLGATFGALAALLLAQHRARVPAEWGVGALFALTSAATILFVAMNPTGDLEMANLLRGELLALTAGDLAEITAATAAVAALLVLFRRELLVTSFDPEFARTIGRVPLRSDALLYGLLGAGISLGVMNAGPLVVFGFLVLPALAALQIAPGIGWAFALSAGFAAASFLGGFGVAYRVDLPTGPVAVALAGVLWLAAAALARLRERRRTAVAAAAALLAVALVLPTLGCGGRLGLGAPRPLGPLPAGTLPPLAADRPIAVLPFANETGLDLHLPSANPLQDLPRAVGDPFAPPVATVPDVLTQRAAFELARRGYTVVPDDRVRGVVPHAVGDLASAARIARDAAPGACALQGTLRRFTITNTGLLLVRLDLALVDPATSRVLWTGSAQRPVAIRSAQTYQEILLDAGGPIFADAFGSR
jgi:zinc transport system permease protein